MWTSDAGSRGVRRRAESTAPRRWIAGAALIASLATSTAQPVAIETGSPAPTAAPAAGGGPYGRRVSEVRFVPPWLRPGDLPLRAGDTLTRENLSGALNHLADRLTRHAEIAARASGDSALVVTYVDATFDDPSRGHRPSADVAVTLRPFHLSLPLNELNGRALPVPRGLTATAASVVPPPSFLPAGLTFENDRVLGPRVGGRWQVERGGDPGRRGATRLHLGGGGAKSIGERYYSGDADLRITQARAGHLLRTLSGGLDLAAALEPRGAAEYRSRARSARGSVELSFGANARMLLDAALGRAEYRYPHPASGDAPRWSRALEQGNRLLFETIPPRLLGFFRAALWQEHLAVRGDGDGQRLVARAGYAKEFLLAPNQSLGLEIIAGAGQTWHDLAAPRRFFAGGSQGEFLHEGVRSRALLAAPDGPLLRSLGKAQGGFRRSGLPVVGGSRFHHVNLNLSLPVPRWSRPLIPDEPTDLPGPDGSPQTLKQILRAQIDRTGPNMLQSTLQTRDGLSPAEARRRAAEVFDEIRPAAHFVIDAANVLAVKPLLMFDLAELHSPTARQTWTAAGAGLQLTVVTAKFELGYMRTLSGPTFGARGNLFARLAFDRLF